MPRPEAEPSPLDGSRLDDCLRRIAGDFGTPCYVYDLDHVRARAARVRRAFGGFGLSFAVKSNPNPTLLARLRDVADELDVSSRGELELALACGWPAPALRFTGPAKGDDELEAAVERGIGAVVLESPEEARTLSRLARARDARQAVLIRVSPAHVPRGFGVQLGGKPSRFGFDEETVPEAIALVSGLPGLSLEGFHLFAGTQCLLVDSLVEHLSATARLFERFAALAPEPPRVLVFGAGFGIPYAEGDEPLDLTALAAGAATALERLRAACPDARLALEMGRYLVGEAGYYLTRVRRLKRSHGSLLAVCDGGMHHNLAACGLLGGVLHRNHRMFVPGARDPGADDASVPEPCDLVGPLCTALDTLGRRVRLPGLRAGAVVAVRSSGAYGLSASPVRFLAHPSAREVLVEQAGGEPTARDVSVP